VTTTRAGNEAEGPDFTCHTKVQPVVQTPEWAVVHRQGSYGGCDYGSCNLDDAALFNGLVGDGEGALLMRECAECTAESHQVVVYKRLTASATVDWHDLFTNNWVSTNNVLNVDFELYSSVQDALAGTNKWTYCNYDDPSCGSVGFARDCGPSGAVHDQWSSVTCCDGYCPSGPRSVQWKVRVRASKRLARYELTTAAAGCVSLPDSTITGPTDTAWEDVWTGDDLVAAAVSEAFQSGDLATLSARVASTCAELPFYMWPDSDAGGHSGVNLALTVPAGANLPVSGTGLLFLEALTGTHAGQKMRFELLQTQIDASCAVTFTNAQLCPGPANDASQSDPTSWELQCRSSAYDQWFLVDSREGFSPPSERFTPYGLPALPVPLVWTDIADPT